MAAEGYSNGGEGAVYGESNLEGRGRTIPDRLILPWDQGWKDKWGMNELVVDGIFGGDGESSPPKHNADGRGLYRQGALGSRDRGSMDIFRETYVIPHNETMFTCVSSSRDSRPHRQMGIA